eukprot:COSAG03_NODE_23955_length_276_cov_0.468927_1_plen_57_part_01
MVWCGCVGGGRGGGAIGRAGTMGGCGGAGHHTCATATERKKRWCGGCGKAHGAINLT